MFYCIKYVIFKEVKYKGELGVKGLEIVVYYKDIVYVLWLFLNMMYWLFNKKILLYYYIVIFVLLFNSCINVLKCIDLW